jgi:hypothetical protein
MKLHAGLLLGAAGALWLAVSNVRAYEVNAKTGAVTLSSLDDFERCQRDVDYSEACLDGLSSYVKAHPTSAFAAGKAARLHFNHWVALRFFERAPGKLTPEQCADADLGMAIVSGLALPSDDPNAALASRIADGPCWSALQERLGKTLVDGSSLYVSNTCALYKKKNVEARECAPQPQAKTAASASLRSAKLASLNAKTLATELSSASLFRGEDTEEVLLIHAKVPRDVVLLKFKGVRGPWNDTIVPAVEYPDSDGKEYIARVDGEDWTIMTFHDGAYQVYPKGYDNGLHVYRRALTDQPKRMAASDVQQEFSPAPSGAKH